ncbi:Pentatricopeptide repeat-containing protein [Quillaja saponaria]|uniref:Pentatricopeptide repeat-containing protein n=1 Tax=Quillaja saponaria TaxID=32244 RepID=A0AAD7PU40_QUISA|nr:Pentatricopeptide repeat-containing protein [Quillaja saponaria]
MFNQSDFQTIHTVDSITHFLHQCRLNKNVRAIKKLHGHLITTGLLFISHKFLTELILTYKNPYNPANFFKCLNPTNPLPFNVIISDFCRNGFPFLALKTLSFMHKNGVPLDTYALCSSLTASSSIKDVSFGTQIHAHVGKSGWSSSVFVGSALIDLYSKVLKLNDAALMFEEIPVKNTVCANALLTGFGEAKRWVEELELVRRMPMLGLDYDQFTLSAALRACAGLSAIELGRQVHGYSLRTVYDVEADAFLQSALIEMYGKCGLVKKAWQVFNLAGISKRGISRDIVLWTSMLGVYGRNGHHKEVITLYKEMLMEAIRPDGVAFVTVISACGHTGQVQLGIKYFESMTNEFKLAPTSEHYSCLIDLLCRAGELHKAWEIMNEKLCDRQGSCSISMWGALISACVDCGNIELGKLAAQRALDLDPKNAGICIMVSNLYARFGMWDESVQLRVSMKDRALRKDRGCSWIQVTN